MLILTRRIAESIIIGDDITITVLGTNGKKVRIGIVAPRDKSIQKKEKSDKNSNYKKEG